MGAPIDKQKEPAKPAQPFSVLEALIESLYGRKEQKNPSAASAPTYQI